MHKIITVALITTALLLGSSCRKEADSSVVHLNTQQDCYEQLIHVGKQMNGLLTKSIEMDRIPRTLTAEGEIHWAHASFDWTEGFFPGSLWLLYDHTKDEKWKKGAIAMQEKFADHRFITSNHDLGFVFNCSYGNGYKCTQNEKCKQYMIDAANSLITRFNPEVGCIQSWDVDRGWQSKRNWQYPVIIDNMMNLELLFNVSELTGDKKYSDIAVKHANTTLKNHFRNDGSSYHVVDYDSINGQVRARETAQGFAHESAWARGQAWGLYGYTVCYRYTKDPAYLKMAEKIATFIIHDVALPEDKVPYWDYDAPQIPNEPRDASAAAIIASALIELDAFSKKNYMDVAKEILESLSGNNYTAALNTNHNFVLMHSVGSIPHNNEIDVPLNYADYYYIEGMLRMGEKLDNGKLALN